MSDTVNLNQGHHAIERGHKPLEAITDGHIYGGNNMMATPQLTKPPVGGSSVIKSEAVATLPYQVAPETKSSANQK